jgi:hypothetical protein
LEPAPAAACRFANHPAALSVARLGAQAAAPRRADVNDFLKNSQVGGPRPVAGSITSKSEWTNFIRLAFAYFLRRAISFFRFPFSVQFLRAFFDR